MGSTMESKREMLRLKLMLSNGVRVKFLGLTKCIKVKVLLFHNVSWDVYRLWRELRQNWPFSHRQAWLDDMMSHVGRSIIGFSDELNHIIP